VRWQQLSIVVSLLLPLAVCSDSHVQGPIEFLSKADRLAMLYNWPEAAHIYGQAESLFVHSGDKEGRLSSRLGYIWATANGGVSPGTVKEVSAYLSDPLVQTNPKLLLRGFIAKAVLDGNQNETAAREPWERILQLSTTLGDKNWQARAKAELGQILYLDGDINTAAATLRQAILSMYLHLDLARRFITQRWSETASLKPASLKPRFNIAISRCEPVVPFPTWVSRFWRIKERLVLSLRLTGRTRRLRS
jgi:hypothetical protein